MNGIRLAPAARLTTVNGATGTMRTVAIASTPCRVMARRMRLSRGPSTFSSVSRPISTPTP